MPDARISQLPAANTPLDGSELVAVVQGDVTSQATAQDIANLGGGGGGSFATALALVNNVGDFIQSYHPGVDSVMRRWSRTGRASTRAGCPSRLRRRRSRCHCRRRSTHSGRRQW